LTSSCLSPSSSRSLSGSLLLLCSGGLAAAAGLMGGDVAPRTVNEGDASARGGDIAPRTDGGGDIAPRTEHEGDASARGAVARRISAAAVTIGLAAGVDVGFLW
jgi:hypothetical protein